VACLAAPSLITAKLPDPDIFDGSTAHAQSQRSAESANNQHSTQLPSNSTSAQQNAPTNGTSNPAPVDSPGEAGRPPNSGQLPSANNTATTPPEQTQTTQGPNKRPSGQNLDRQNETASRQPSSTVDLSIFRGSRPAPTVENRTFPEAPRGNGEPAIEVPDDFATSTSLQGVLEAMREEREVERKKVIEQIENDPNRGSEEGAKLPTDL